MSHGARAEALAPPDGPAHIDGPRSALFYLGYNVLGPAFTLFTRRLIARAADAGVESLFFAARDGWLLEQLYALQAPPPRLAHRYVYLSRRATALASVRRLSLRELRVGLLPAESRTLARALAAFDLADDELLQLARAAGADVDRPLTQPYLFDPAVAALVESAAVQRAVADRAADARARLRRYLAKEGFFAARSAALVDVGWRGTLFEHLWRAFGEDRDWPHARGLYVGYIVGDDAGERHHQLQAGLLVDTRRPTDLRGRAILYFLDIFEQAARADHGTTLGYRDDGNTIVPVLDERSGDRAAEAATAGARGELQRGILAYAAAESRPRHAPLGDDEVLRRVERFVFRPTDAELEAIGRLVHTDEWGLSRWRGLLEGAGRALLLHPQKLWRAYQTAYWRPGFLRKTGGPVLARIYHALQRLRG